MFVFWNGKQRFKEARLCACKRYHKPTQREVKYQMFFFIAVSCPPGRSTLHLRISRHVFNHQSWHRKRSSSDQGIPSEG